MVTYKGVFFISLHCHEILIETPCFTRKNSINISLVVEGKKNCVIAKILNLETIISPPQRIKSSCNYINV
ncbi:hypothetical protein ACB092_01G359800 [Castanea dentata]